MLNDKALDRIEEAMQVLVDALEAEGLVGIMAYHVEQEAGVFSSHVISSNAKAEHFLSAFTDWTAIAAARACDYLSEEDE